MIWQNSVTIGFEIKSSGMWHFVRRHLICKHLNLQHTVFRNLRGTSYVKIEDITVIKVYIVVIGVMASCSVVNLLQETQSSAQQMEAAGFCVVLVTIYETM